MVTRDRHHEGNGIRRRDGAGSRRAIAFLTSLGLAWSLALGIATPMAAAPGYHLDISPESADVTLNVSISVTATVVDDDGDPVTSSHIRWYFAGGSPNDPNTGNNSPDFDCTTDASGSCTVSYTPTVLGTDVLCALAGGSPSACDEPLGSGEWDDNADVVERVVVPTTGSGSTPTPTPTPSPSATTAPTPTASPAPTASQEPTATPTPTSASSETSAPTRTPTPDESAAPSETPMATPTATASPVATPSPTQTPTEAPTEAPTATPTSTPTPTPAPGDVTPSPDEHMPSSVTAPSQEPTVPIFEPGPDEAPAIVEPPGDGATGPIDDIDDPDAAPASPEPRPGPRNVPREIGSGKGLRSATPGTTASAPVPAAPELPSEPAVTAGPGAIVGQVFGQVVSAAAEQVGRYVRPDAVVAVAGEFTFPLALALAVLVFLVVQDQVDRRDPKLRIAPQNIVETLVQFEGEDQL